MKNTFLVILFFCSVNQCLAQSIESRSKALIEIKNKLVANIDSIPLQNEYLKLFPSDEKEFQNVFYSEESLLKYNESSYTFLLGAIIKNNPNDIVLRIINISIDFPKQNKYDIGALREIILIYAFRFSDSFILNFDNLTNQKRRKLFTYIADVENHEFYSAYHMVLEKYKLLNKEIAEYLIKYRALRMKRHHH